MTGLILGPKEWLAIGLALAIILDVAAWRSAWLAGADGRAPR